MPDPLLDIDQGTQHRFFTYDSLSRLKTAKNPEQVSGSTQIATTYDYDPASNLITKTGPNSGSSVGFTYDGLNRVKTKTLSSGGVWDYTYDTGTISNGKGRLVSVALHGGTDGYYYDGYDAMGRVMASRQVTTAGTANSYTMSYQYNLAGSMTQQTYPSGKIFVTEYDDAGRIAGVKRATSYYAGGSPTDAANRIQYAPHGAVGAMKLGNGKWEHTVFNGRLQPTEIGLGVTSGASDLLKLEYKYGVLVSNVLDTTQNNGNIQSQIITAPKTQSGNLVLTQKYTYDALNRLSFAEEVLGAASQWNQTYDIDRWGNRAVRNSSTYIPSLSLTPISTGSTDFSAFNQGTNRLAMSGFGYDTSGNLKNDPNTPANGIVYDAENHQTSYAKAGVGTTNYSYDGDGHRVKKTDPNNNTTIFVYNVAGQLIAEYTSGTPSGGGTSYLTSDHLGSTRVVTGAADGSGNVMVKARYDYLPFGEEIASDHGSRTLVTGYGATDGTRQKFTQKERDSESGLDYFGARYYSSAQGRFTSVDPITVTPPRMVDPQQLNLYAYVRNNPLAYIDPTGMVIDVSRLSEDDLKRWKRIGELANRKDDKGNYVNSKLHEVYERLQSDQRTFFIENHSFGDKSGTIGEMTITKHNGNDDFTEAVIQIDFKKAKNTATTTAADLVAGFNKFEGLLDQGDKGADARLAEVFGHEGGHGIYDLNNLAEAVKTQMLLTDRDAALKAMPKGTRYPYPPDVMQKMADADRALIPTERFAQQTEKIINGELRATLKRK